MNELKEAKQELQEVEEVLAMADRAIQISRQEQERLSSDLPTVVPEQAGLNGPAAAQPTDGPDPGTALP
jgi:hypothetical protein